MIAKQNLLEAYRWWEKWTQHESLAIEEANWGRVSECQKEKQELQSRIIGLTGAANEECAEAGDDAAEFARELRRIINGLIVLETRNAELLSERRAAVESEKSELDQASRNLRRVQKSYVQPATAAWHSYS